MHKNFTSALLEANHEAEFLKSNCRKAGFSRHIRVLERRSFIRHTSASLRPKIGGRKCARNLAKAIWSRA